MARDFEVSYPVEEAKTSTKFNNSLDSAESRLLALKGYIGAQNQKPRFVVYPRGKNHYCSDVDYRVRRTRRPEVTRKAWERFVLSLAYPSITFMPPQNATLPAICWAFSLGAE